MNFNYFLYQNKIIFKFHFVWPFWSPVVFTQHLEWDENVSLICAQNPPMTSHLIQSRSEAPYTCSPATTSPITPCCLAICSSASCFPPVSCRFLPQDLCPCHPCKDTSSPRCNSSLLFRLLASNISLWVITPHLQPLACLCICPPPCFLPPLDILCMSGPLVVHLMLSRRDDPWDQTQLSAEHLEWLHGREPPCRSELSSFCCTDMHSDVWAAQATPLHQLLAAGNSLGWVRWVTQTPKHRDLNEKASVAHRPWWCGVGMPSIPVEQVFQQRLWISPWLSPFLQGCIFLSYTPSLKGTRRKSEQPERVYVRCKEIF